MGRLLFGTLCDCLIFFFFLERVSDSRVFPRLRLNEGLFCDVVVGVAVAAALVTIGNESCGGVGRLGILIESAENVGK
jgi:hypothetical protein